MLLAIIFLMLLMKEKNYQDYKNRVIPVIKFKLTISDDYVTVKSDG